MSIFRINITYCKCKSHHETLQSQCQSFVTERTVPLIKKNGIQIAETKLVDDIKIKTYYIQKLYHGNLMSHYFTS